MSEYHVQVLYAIFATAGTALIVRTLVSDWFSDIQWLQRKPFNCVFCLTFWLSIFICMIGVDCGSIATAFITVITVHFLAYVATQKLI